MLNDVVWTVSSSSSQGDLPERWSVKEQIQPFAYMHDGISDNIFRMLSLDAEIQETSPDVSIAKAHQISAGDRKDSSSSC